MIKKELYITLFMNWAVKTCYNSKGVHIFNMFLYDICHLICGKEIKTKMEVGEHADLSTGPEAEKPERSSEGRGGRPDWGSAMKISKEDGMMNRIKCQGHLTQDEGC